VIIRYPKGACPTEQPAFSEPLRQGRGVFVHEDGTDCLIVTTGGVFPEALEASNLLARAGKPADLYNLRFVKPIDEAAFVEAIAPYKGIVFVEDGVLSGGVGAALAEVAHARAA
jgi:1-deoxy-D-xylulose-5-phosphate synthase